MEIKDLTGQENWDVLLSFFPGSWDRKAKELGALYRCRKFVDAESLLRTLLIHLADGCSLRETAVRASEGNIASVSDVALLKRLRASGKWFRWMAVQLMERWVTKQPALTFEKDFRIRIIDATTIQEPGNTGSTWRLHYSIGLPSLQCDEVHLTSPKAGESLKRFSVHPGELILADRGYAHCADVGHVVRSGGNVIVRMNTSNLPCMNMDGSPFVLMEHLRTLTGTKPGDWDVFTMDGTLRVTGRICGIKKSMEAAEKARRKVIRDGQTKGRKVQPETLEASGYVFVFTTLDRSFPATAVLEMYRGRWQVELAFKRLKSIMQLGHLKKKDNDAATAWIHGKLFLAFLIEALVVAGESFSPWGYPIREDIEKIAMPVAGDFIYAPSG